MKGIRQTPKAYSSETYTRRGPTCMRPGMLKPCSCGHSADAGSCKRSKRRSEPTCSKACFVDSCIPCRYSSQQLNMCVTLFHYHGRLTSTHVRDCVTMCKKKCKLLYVEQALRGMLDL